MRIHQQGDVLLNPITKIPSAAKALAPKAGRYILAEGEATGHAHAIEATPDVEVYEHNGTMYLRVKSDTVLRHEEHHAHTIEPGLYEIGRVVEVDPFDGEIRTIAD